MAFKQTPHPIHPEFTDKEMLSIAESKGVEFLQGLLEEREQAIALAINDPLNSGFELEPWKRARSLLSEADELLILGGNRAGKTDFAAKFVVETMCAKDRCNVWCLHSTLPSSIEMQQPVIRRYLPPEWRDIGKQGKTTNVRWTDKGGFSDQVFILPNGSRCRFLNYSMLESVFEGGELDLIWADELIGYDLVKTLRFRIATRSGKLIVTFTPVKGYSMTVKEYQSGARVLESAASEMLPNNVNVPGCPPGHMPYTLQPIRRNAKMICFHSIWNPFGGYENVKKMLEGKSTEEVKIRAYGWAERLEGKAFPKFNENVHVVPEEKVPEKGTRYCSVDPAGSKNWFIKWYLVDNLNRVFLYREWPPRQQFGEWALPSDKADGKPGPAQTGLGLSLVSYKKLILKLEDGEEIYRRIIDSRFGGAEVPSAKSGMTPIIMLEQDDHDEEGNEIVPGMVFFPAPGGQIEDGIQGINDMLDYDESKPVSMMNCPRYYISEACEQSIYAYAEYTGLDGLKGALKDVIDPDRYMFKDGIYHFDPVAFAATGGDAPDS
jgi:hypothetical protein